LIEVLHIVIGLNILYTTALKKTAIIRRNVTTMCFNYIFNCIINQIYEWQGQSPAV